MKRSTVRVTLAPQSADGTPSFDSALEWIGPDGVTEFQFQTSELHDNLWQQVIAYGLKQIIADGGAVGRDVPAAERRAKMEKRAAALRNGTWSFRDGHGSSATPAASDSAMMFAALVAVGIVPDIPEARETWKNLKPTQRRAAFDAAGDAAKAHYDAAAAAAARATPIDGAALLAAMTGNVNKE